METIGSCRKEEEKLELPPGFRFHPTDEELISHYLSQKVLDCSFISRAIGEVDLNKCEPWDLPWKAKMGEREWYFFCVRDRKYPTGLRTNRATDAGYWKATGKDKEISRLKMVVGMKKTLVFYKGRAPKGEKTNWVMHEFRLEGKFSVYNFPKTSKNEWVICRVFQKTTGGKKIPISGLSRSILPPLTEAGAEAPHVTCFSGTAGEDQKPTQGHVIANTTATTQHIITTPINSFYNPNLEYPDSIFAQDQTLLRMLCDNNININNNVNGTNMNMVMMRSDKEEFSPGAMSTDMSSAVSNLDVVQRQFEEQDEPSTSGAPVDLDCLWSY